MDVVWEEKWLDVGWGRLAAKTCLTGGRQQQEADTRLKVVGVHGWLDNANTFDTLIPLLPAGLEVLVVDFPGHGHSDHLPPGAHHHILTYSINFYLALCSYGWDRFVFLGHSLGASVCYYYTALFPEHVLAIITLDALGSEYDMSNVIHWRKTVRKLLKTEQQVKEKNSIHSQEKAIERIVETRGGVGNITNLDEESAYILLPRSAQQIGNGYQWNHDPKARSVVRFVYCGENFRIAAASVQCPMLVVFAIDGFYVKHWKPHLDGNLQAVKANKKWCDVEYVEGTHYVHLNHPERVAPLVSTFIKKVVEIGLYPPQSKL